MDGLLTMLVTATTGALTHIPIMCTVDQKARSIFILKAMLQTAIWYLLRLT